MPYDKKPDERAERVDSVTPGLHSRPVADLMGAEARAILLAVEKNTAQVVHLRAESDKLDERVGKVERAAWASRDAAVAAHEAAKNLSDKLKNTELEIKQAIVAASERFGTKVQLLTDAIDQERIQRQSADKKLASKQALITTKFGDLVVSDPLQGPKGRKPDVRGSLSDVDHFEEITKNTLISHFIDRAKEDADFQAEAARAGLGLRVMTWKTVLKWGTVIVGSATAGGALAKLLWSLF